LVQKKTERKIKTVRSDNGTEYNQPLLRRFSEVRRHQTRTYCRNCRIHATTKWSSRKEKQEHDSEVPDDPIGALRKFMG
jgi:hypothetical protein